MKILVSGASGLVGTALVNQLREKGHIVHCLTRKKSENPYEFYWNYTKKEIDENAFDGIAAIIHLAGASIGERWTNAHKKEIISSRVDSANFLKEQCIKLGIRLQSFISSSGINYYGTFTSDNILYEDSEIRHRDFLSEVCEQWEKAAFGFQNISEKIVIIRTAPVLSKKGGSFEPLKKISDYHLSSGIGSGKQWFNWIHLHDLVEIYVQAIENAEMKGIYNAVADEIPTNKNFMKRLANANRKLFIPINVPAFIIKLILGEMSEMILKGTRASNKKIKSLGFQLKFPNLDSALKNLLDQ